MTRLTLTTFNCENLMMRCDFRRLHILDAARKFTAVSDQSDADAVDRVFNVLSEDDRTLTAQALSASQADICCLQEVENLLCAGRKGAKSFASSQRLKGRQQETRCARVFARSPRQHLKGASFSRALGVRVKAKGRRASTSRPTSYPPYILRSASFVGVGHCLQPVVGLAFPDRRC